MFNNKPASNSEWDQLSYLVALHEHVAEWLDNNNIDEDDRPEFGRKKYRSCLYAFMESGNSYADMCNEYRIIHVEILNEE
jgi:hypothetical protein